MRRAAHDDAIARPLARSSPGIGEGSHPAGGYPCFFAVLAICSSAICSGDTAPGASAIRS